MSRPVPPEVVGEVGQVRTASTNGILADRAIHAARSARDRAGGDGAARRPYRQPREAPGLRPGARLCPTDQPQHTRWPNPVGLVTQTFRLPSSLLRLV